MSQNADEEQEYEERREELVEHISAVRDLDEDVLDAIRSVPRHEFLPEDEHDRAYVDMPIPIGSGQTVSAPHIVAIMADLPDLEAGEDVLEVGTGCGYHAAVTAELVGAEHVYTVEYESDLVESARENLADAGYGDVSVRHGDGREGWPEYAPFDAAYLTCAVPEFPDPLIEQVREGGRLLGPVGVAGQELILAEKRDDELDEEHHGEVQFVRIQG
ncbi:protein-L-isoaspartate(D-aspartate) O-methyltransferase [Halospeciosus flavus]|uniref:Protein-L-isoaspartate O-methyltransferase n=1 Tax=Halospeciosus flavus TaxID=3032283 RepID=A0ABD5Z6G6_9EURY|nr:protein-L-isoaspartate(D-aspartate) O-methyltransferase [Halospeciosus flavus]